MADNIDHLADASVNINFTPGSFFAGSGIRGTGWLRRRWLYHTVFWVLYFAFLILLYIGMYMVYSPLFFVELIGSLGLVMAVVYLNLYLLIPRLLFGKKYVLYCLSLITSLLAFSLLSILVNKGYARLGSKLFAPMATYNMHTILIYCLDNFYVIGLTTAIKFVKDSVVKRQWMEEKEKQYLETELNFLKTQIQPHFFFNTLNNLYSLTLKKSDLAPEIVLKLSALMSYMLYESNSPLVPLEKEVAYLRNYLDVEQLRFGSRLSVSFTIEGHTADVNIPPMILILFIENSFKHGVKNNINKINIDLSLVVADGYLHFRIENPIGEDEASTESAGIGLRNGRRRLDLLYADRYLLDISAKDGLFVVALKIPVC